MLNLSFNLKVIIKLDLNLNFYFLPLHVFVIKLLKTFKNFKNALYLCNLLVKTFDFIFWNKKDLRQKAIRYEVLKIKVFYSKFFFSQIPKCKSPRSSGTSPSEQQGSGREQQQLLNKELLARELLMKQQEALLAGMKSPQLPLLMQNSRYNFVKYFCKIVFLET